MTEPIIEPGHEFERIDVTSAAHIDRDCASQPFWRDVLSRFAGNRGAVFGAVTILVIVVLVLKGPVVGIGVCDIGPPGDGSGRSVGPGRPVRVVLLLKVAIPRAIDAEPRDRLIVLPLILVGPPPSRAVGGRRAPSGTRSGGRRDGLGKNRGDGSIGSTDGIRAGDGSDAIRSRGAGRAHRCSFRSQPRATTVLDAWARGRTIMESMLTWAGRSSAQVMHSAMSCALRGPSTPA